MHSTADMPGGRTGMSRDNTIYRTNNMASRINIYCHLLYCLEGIPFIHALQWKSLSLCARDRLFSASGLKLEM